MSTMTNQANAPVDAVLAYPPMSRGLRGEFERLCLNIGAALAGDGMDTPRMAVIEALERFNEALSRHCHGTEATTEHAEHTEDRAALAALADEMHAKCESLFGGARLGQWAAALLVDSYADRIERALGIQPAPRGARPPEGGNALAHSGLRVKEDAPGGRHAFELSTPYEGASIEAAMGPHESGRDWTFCCRVRNNRGIGWTASGQFSNCGRHVAKKLLTTLALELRRAYTHRGQKIRKRAIARAIARREAEQGND